MGSVNSFMSKFGNLPYSDESEEPSLLSASAPNALGAFMEKFTTLTESYFFYEGTVELRFDTEDHKYYRVGELGNLIKQHGVTDDLHVIDKSYALVPWAVRKAAEKLLRTIPLSAVKDEFGSFMLAPITLEEFTKLVMEAKDAHREILTDAGDIGHLAHKCLEDSIQHAIDYTGGVVIELRNLPTDEKALACAQAAFAWMKQHDTKWLKTEQKIYSLEYEYAGTMDGKCLVSPCTDPSCCTEQFPVDSLSIADWKSSNALRIEYVFQVAGAYEHAEREEYGEDIQNCFILRLGKNEEEAGKFEPWRIPAKDFPEAFAGFLACHRLTQLIESVTERMRVQKKGVRAIKKQMNAEQKEITKMKAKVEKAAAKAQLKLDRAVEKERIKADAKKAREEAKLAKKSEKERLLLGEQNTVPEARGDTELEQSKPVHEVPRQAEDTPASAVVPETSRELPKVAGDYEEAPIAHVPFVIPEED